MDWKPLAKPKHIVLTTIVALVAGSTLALAAADVEPDIPAGLDAPVELPLPQVGDNGRYVEWRSVGAARESGSPYSTFEFTWGEDALQPNATGALLWTNLLHARFVYPTQDGQVDRNQTFLLRAGTDEIVAEDQFHAASSAINGTPPGTQAWSSHNRWYTAERIWSGHPCLRHGLQGTVLDLTKPYVDGFACPWLSDRVSATHFRIAAVGGQPGARDVVLVLESQEFPAFFPTALGRVWLREGVPYPLRIEDLHGDGTINHVVVLEAFDAGTTPLRGLTPPEQPASPLQTAPLQPWGLDETGVHHPFPLSAAFAAARDDAGYADLRDFLAANPDAYTAWARGTEYRTEDRQFRWDFAVTNGQEVVATIVTSTQPNATTALPLGLAAPTGRVSVQPSDDDGVFDGFQALPGPPPAMPTVAALQGLWEKVASPAFLSHGANTWSFQIGTDPDGPGGTPGVYLAAGHVHFEAAPAPGLVGPLSPFGTQRWVTSGVAWYDDLEAISRLDESISETTYVAAAPSPTLATPPPGPAQDAQATTVTAGTAMFELDRREVATLGLGTLLVSGLYYLWPLAKGGLVGLFSRLRSDRLLENPVRQHLHSFVEANPGIHHNALVREAGKGKGAVEHHLDKLVAGGLVLRHRGSGFTCYFPVGTDRRVMPGFQVTKSEGARRILEAMGRGVTGVRQLAAVTGLSPSTVSHHLARLRTAGLVVGDGRIGYQAVAGGPTEGAPAAA